MDQRIRGSASGESIDVRLSRLAAKRHGLFTRAQAVEAGATRGLIDRRVASRRWEPLYPAVYRMPGAPKTWRQALLAACLVSGPGAAASHRAAGCLWALPGGEKLLELSVVNARRVTRPGIKVYSVGALDAVDVTMIDAIPVTSCERTIIDLAAVFSTELLEEALDEALRRGWTRPPRLRWRIAELGRRGRTGIGVLHRLVEARLISGARSESTLETRFLRLLRRSRLPMPVPQYEMRVGRRRMRLDFAYPDLGLAIEVDGYRWHSSRSRWQRDLERGNLLMRSGWTLLRFTSSDIDDRPEFVSTMTAGALQDRREASRPTSRS
jgi:very-short-patch-repair endonuclease